MKCSNFVKTGCRLVLDTVDELINHAKGTHGVTLTRDDVFTKEAVTYSYPVKESEIKVIKKVQKPPRKK